MITVHKLTKTVSGSLAIGAATAASLLIAPSAGAVHFICVLDAQGLCSVTGTPVGSNTLDIGGTIYDSVIIGDKVFQDFSWGLIPQDNDTVTIETNSNTWNLTYNFIPIQGPTPPFQLHYAVDILDASRVFDTVSLSAIVPAPGVQIVKDIFDSNNPTLLLDTLTSLNGALDVTDISDFNVRHIKVIDTITINAGGQLLSVTNHFTQTPEPGTILGLLAVGGVGLVSKLKKQK